MDKLSRIESAIAVCEDKKKLRLLNKLWWRIYFGMEKEPIVTKAESTALEAARLLLRELSERFGSNYSEGRAAEAFDAASDAVSHALIVTRSHLGEQAVA